jgi:hypothetical protein
MTSMENEEEVHSLKDEVDEMQFNIKAWNIKRKYEEKSK